MIPILQVSVFSALAVAVSLGALLLLSGEAGARGGRSRISNYHEEYRAAAKPYSGVQGRNSYQCQAVTTYIQDDLSAITSRTLG